MEEFEDDLEDILEEMKEDLTKEIGLKANEEAQAMVEKLSKAFDIKMHEQQSQIVQLLTQEVSELKKQLDDANLKLRTDAWTEFSFIKTTYIP